MTANHSTLQPLPKPSCNRGVLTQESLCSAKERLGAPGIWTPPASCDEARPTTPPSPHRALRPSPPPSPRRAADLHASGCLPLVVRRCGGTSQSSLKPTHRCCLEALTELPQTQDSALRAKMSASPGKEVSPSI